MTNSQAFEFTNLQISHTDLINIYIYRICLLVLGKINKVFMSPKLNNKCIDIIRTSVTIR